MNTFEFKNGQSFITEVKNYWHTSLYQALEGEYGKLEALANPKPQTPKEVEALLRDNTTYQVFAWIERNMQRFKYSGRYGLVAWYARQDNAALFEKTSRLPNLKLDPALEMPRYYVNCDIHQHPGGVWSHETGGLVYQHAAQTTTPLDGQRHADLHAQFVAKVREKFPQARRILELGCGFGKTTAPLKDAYPEADIVAIDLSGPCLQVAAANVPGVEFRQADAASTPFEDGAFDLVVSSMFLHEMPPPQVAKVIAECDRVTDAQGGMVHLDFYVFPSVFRRFMHYSHGRRNNEPFMEPLAEMDLPGELRAHHFVHQDIEAFEETPGAASPQFNKWRYPWTVITASRAS